MIGDPLTLDVNMGQQIFSDFHAVSIKYFQTNPYSSSIIICCPQDP